MKDNYKNGRRRLHRQDRFTDLHRYARFRHGKIEANKDSVVRSKSFSVTVTGKPSPPTTSGSRVPAPMTGGYDDQPPMVDSATRQASMINLDNPALADAGIHRFGDYQYENGSRSVNLLTMLHPVRSARHWQRNPRLRTDQLLHRRYQDC